MGWGSSPNERVCIIRVFDLTVPTSALAPRWFLRIPEPWMTNSGTGRAERPILYPSLPLLHHTFISIKLLLLSRAGYRGRSLDCP